MKTFSYYFFIVLVILLSAIYLPRFYEKIFFTRIERTHLFYSPVTRDFILTEKIVGPVPQAVHEKAEDHHAAIAYQNADGTYVSRVEFEKKLPFIYYKNMELWGLLPIELNGRSFDAATIKENRRVMELTPGEIHGRSPETPVWPLFEANTGRVRLVFPEDRFRMTPTAMEFINADTLRVDRSLTTLFTQALIEQGFTFPCRSVNGKFSVLKPFDAGVFLVDAENRVFHLKRINDRPWVVKTPIGTGPVGINSNHMYPANKDQKIQVRHIKISESRQKDYDGLVLSQDGQIYLLTHYQPNKTDGYSGGAPNTHPTYDLTANPDGDAGNDLNADQRGNPYRVIPLPLGNYDPDRMRLKLIFNPLYCTAVFSDDTKIYGVAMDKSFHVIKRFSHTMSSSTATPAKSAYQFLFPFSLHLEKKASGFLSLTMQAGHLWSIAGVIFCLFCYIGWTILVQKKKFSCTNTILICITGVYGLIALLISPCETPAETSL